MKRSDPRMPVCDYRLSAGLFFFLVRSPLLSSSSSAGLNSPRNQACQEPAEGATIAVRHRWRAAPTKVKRPEA